MADIKDTGTRYWRTRPRTCTTSSATTAPQPLAHNAQHQELQQGEDGDEEAGGEVVTAVAIGGGSAEACREKVRGYFQALRESLSCQEVAALTTVESHVRERLQRLTQHRDDTHALLAQIRAMTGQCHHAAQQNDVHVILAKQEVATLLDTIDKQQQQFAELPASSSLLSLDPAIPITFTKDNRVHIGPKIEMRVVLLGLDEAGKTTVLFKLKQNEFMHPIPTIGFNVESVDYKNLKFTMWDVGGQPKLRPLWKHYYLNTQAIIFVIDSSNGSRMLEAYTELNKLLVESELRDAILLILANKQDIEGALPLEELVERLNLNKLCYGRSWHIQACDAVSGSGLEEAVDWLSHQLVAASVLHVTDDVTDDVTDGVTSTAAESGGTAVHTLLPTTAV